MTTKYTYILYTGAVEAGGLSEANKAASGGECVGWLRLLLLLFLFDGHDCQKELFFL